MNLTDALFNWLQIKRIADTHPEDRAAKDTLAFFDEVLREDHGLEQVEIAAMDATIIHLSYRDQEGEKRQQFARPLADQLLADLDLAAQGDERE